MLFNTMRFTLILCVAFTLVAASCDMEASKSGPPIFNEYSTLAEALKYLQELELYYGNKARIRYGKRGSLMQTLRHRIPENAIMSSIKNNEIKSDNNDGVLVKLYLLQMHAAGEDEIF